MRPLPPQAALQHGVFTVAQARAAGWTGPALRHAVARGRLIVLRRVVLALALQSTAKAWLDERAAHRLAAAAAVLARPGALASHVAAALLVDLPVLTTPHRPCLTVPAGSSGDVPGVHLHRTVLDRGERGRFGLLGLTLAHRTVVDIARELGEAAGVVTADAAMRRGLLTADDLNRAVRAAAGRPGAAAARAMAAAVDPRAESPLESVSRLAIRDAGLPAPWLQPNILVGGRFVGRPDFCWDEFGVVGEADGWEKYEAGWQRLRDEKRRQERFEEAGLVVVRWGWDDLDRFDRVAARLLAALRRGSRLPRSERRWVARPTGPWRRAG